MEIKRIGVDLAKNVFQVHGVDERDRPVLNKRLSRAKFIAFMAKLAPCQVVMEACSGAHHWGRELERMGHAVGLIDARRVIPYRKGGKNDCNDAEAICEAGGRPSMRFIPLKSVEQQAVLTVHRARALLVEQRTSLVNHIRGLLTEFGIVLAQGRHALRRALPEILEDGDNAVPDPARLVFSELYQRLLDFEQRIAEYDRRIKTLAEASPEAQRLMQLPGIGPLTATAVLATVAPAHAFNNGRQFAAWLGLTPRQNSSGGKIRLGRITKRGDIYLRTLLVHGARSVVRLASKRTDSTSHWINALRERRGFNKATVALAAKNARILWVLLARGEHYRAPTPALSGA